MWWGLGLTVHEAALAHVGVAADQQGAGVGLDGGQPAHVLPHLLQVGQAGPLLLHDGAHAPLRTAQAPSQAAQGLTCTEFVGFRHNYDKSLTNPRAEPEGFLRLTLRMWRLDVPHSVLSEEQGLTSAARLSSLHRYSESPYFISRT